MPRSSSHVLFLLRHMFLHAIGAGVPRWMAILISRSIEGKIGEEWLLWDRLGLWQQLGVIPATVDLFAPGGPTHTMAK